MTNGLSTVESRNLAQLGRAELQEFLDSFDVILCDCDGVIWTMVDSIPRAGEAVQLLKAKGKQVKFVSNNSLRSDGEYMEKFKKIGISGVEENDLTHPVKTMIWYLQQSKPNCTVFPLIPPAAVDILPKHGIKTVPVDFAAYGLESVEFMKILLTPDAEKVTAVLADINLYTTITHLTKALQYLKDENCELILGAMDSKLVLMENLYVPGFLDVYNILTKHSGKEPVCLGKPSPLLGDFLKERYAIDNPKRCLFIGDSLRQDIGFGKHCGFQTLLVLTGTDSKEDMLKADSDQKPDYYIDALANLLDLLKDE